MITASALRRKMKDAHLDATDLRTVAARFVEPHAVATVAGRMGALLAAAARQKKAVHASHGERFAARSGLQSREWRTKAEALSELDAMRLWEDFPTSDIPQALAVALNELSESPTGKDAFVRRAEACGMDEEEARAAAMVSVRIIDGRQKSGRTDEGVKGAFDLASAATMVRDAASKRHLTEAALIEMIGAHDRARVADGEDVARSVRAELAAAEGGNRRTAERLAARAAGGVLHREPGVRKRIDALAAGLETSRRASAEAAASFLLRLWKSHAVRTDMAGLEAEDARALGAAASGTLHGFATDHEAPADHRAVRLAGTPDHATAYDEDESVTLIAFGWLPIRIERRWLRRFAPLTMRALIGRLETLSEDRGLDGPLKLKFLTLAEAVREDMVGRRDDGASFGTWIGLADYRTASAGLSDGLRVHAAVPTGAYRARIACAGKNGRTVICRALSDDEGRMVGYAAFDPLSAEFRGQGHHAAYDLQGKRVGQVQKDTGDWRIHFGEPTGGFVTVPERVDL